MTRLVVLATLVLTAVLGGSATAPAHPVACSAGVTQLKGEDVRVFCGPARATVRFAGKTYRFTNGLCEKTPGTGLGALAVNIGIQALPPSTPRKFFYFGVALEKAKGGTYRNQAVGISVPGTRGLSPLVNRVTVSADLKRGSFTGTTTVQVKGRLLPKKVPISGSWRC